MKKKFTMLIAALALLTMTFQPLRMLGQTRDVYTYTFTSNAWTENGSATLNEVDWILNMNGGTISSFDNTKGMHFGTNNNTCNSVSISTSGISGTITDVTVEASRGSQLVGGLSISVGETDFYNGESTTNALTTSNETYSYTGSASGDIDILWTKTSGKGAYYIKSITVTYTAGGGSTTPSINASNQNIAYDATSGSIPYTISNPSTGNSLSATCTESWVSNINVTGTEVTFSTTQNTENTARSATFTLTYTGATDKTVTVTQAAAPVIYTTIPDLFAAATSAGNTATNVTVTFGNWVVSGVSTNGKNVFVTDGANGFVIFNNSGNLGFTVGDILSGTAACKVQLYNGFAEITQLNSSTEGISIATGGTVTAANIGMADLTGVNTGALVHYDNLTCSIVNNKYYLGNGTDSIQVYNSLFAFDALTNGDTYNITGVYQQYNATKEVLPRSAADIEEVVADPVLTVSATSLTGFTYTEGSGPSAAQSFTVAGDNLTEDVTVTAPTNFVVCATENGTYNSSMTITASGTLAATTVYVKLAAGLSAGNYSGNLTATSGTASKTIALSGEVTAMQQVATPTFNPAAGTYTEAQNVAITCATEGATIYYTLDNTDPTVNSTVYSNPIAISQTTTVKAMAAKNGMANSEIASATYTINIPTPAQETTYTLITNANALIAGEKYIIVAVSGENYKALGKQNNNNRAAFEVTISNNATTLTPASTANDEAVFELTLGQDSIGYWTLFDAVNNGYLYAAGTGSSNYLKTQEENNVKGQWTIEIDTEGIATIKAPSSGTTRNWIRYNNSSNIFSCYASGQMNVYIYKAGDVPTVETVATPTFNPAAGTYTEAQNVTIACATEGATIYYTLDGTTPTTASSVYSTAIAISQTTTVKAMAVKTGMTNSQVATAEYTINLPVPTVATPTFNPAAGTYTEAQNVTIACATEGASIYYTLDGTDPTTASSVYSTAIAISQTTTVKAMAVKTGMTDSEIASASYTINTPTPGQETTYTLITSVSDLTVGDKYLIVALNGEEYDAMGKQNTGNRSGVSVTNSSNSITITPAATDSDSAPFEFTLGQEGEYWTLYDAVTGGYLYAASSSQNQLKTQATNDENGEWSIEFNTDGTAEVVAHGSNTRNYMRFNPNNGNPIFSSYASTSSVVTRVSFYKAGGTPSVPTVATPTFSPIAGTYTEAQSVTIACATEGASIYYTLDGSTPTASSTLYTAPIAVATTTTIKAIATKEGYNNSAVATAEYEIEEGSVVIFNQTWENGMDGWSFVNVTGTAEWEIGDSNNNYYAGINAYQQGATEAWCISPAFSLDTRGNITLSFRTAKKYSGNDLQAFFCNDYDGTNPSTATWTELTFPLSTGNYEWVESGDISLNGFSGTNCYIGFKYTSTETQAASWRVDNIMLKNQTSTTFLTVMPSTLNGFYYVIDNGPSAAQSFAITGSNLTDDVTVTAPTNYEISETETGTYATSLTLPLTNGAISSTVFVRLVAGLEVESYEGELTVVSDTLTATLALNGFVSLYPVPVLTATPNSVSGMTYEYSTGGPSNIVSFNLSAVDLHAHVHVYPSEHFEVSTYGDTLFMPENPAVISAVAGSFTNIPIYVRLMDSLPGPSYNEQLTIATDGCDTLYVNVSGTVTNGPTPTPPTPTPPTPGTGDYVRISSLSDLVDGSQVIIAARYDDVVNSYYAMPNTASGKPEGELFASMVSESNEILPASIADADTAYYWMVGVSGSNYTFTNHDGIMIGYGTSGTDFVAGSNTDWTVTAATSEANAMVPEYNGFNILNVSTNTRGFALNNQGKFGAYSTTNLNNGSYNFYLDFFVKGEGSTPTGPVVATPTFTPEAGTYAEAQMVTIACATDSATIHFTLDGSTPTATSPQYTAPLTISTTTTIKAIAMRDGYDNSAVATATYTIQAGTTVIFNQDWEGDWNGWTQVSVAGDSTWRISQNNGNHYAYMNAYQDTANEDWLISPAFNVNDIDNPVLTFRTARKYNGPDIQVYFSNNYNGTNPSAATWQALTCTLSTGNNWNWAESGNISLSSFSGTNCYIGFKYISTDTQAAGWEVDDIMLVSQTTAPIVSVAPTTLTGFTYLVDNGPSTQQSFTIEGMNLTANVTVTAATDFEISTVMGTGFTAQNTITLVPVNGSIDTMIYVRLKAGLAEGTYTNENIVVASTGAATVNVVCSGQVTGNQPPVPPTGDYVRIADASVLANGDKVILASRYNTTANAYLAVANTLTSGKLGTTEFTSATSGTDEIIPSTLNEDDYYWTVNVTGNSYTFTNAEGQTISYNSSTNFNFTGDKTAWTIASGTSEESALVPNYTGFNIINVDTDNRGFALRVTESASVVGAYSTSNMNNGEYNFYLDIFRQGEGGGTPTVAAPTFTPAGGTYNGPQSVTINCATAGATIYYSTISATGDWTEYEGPIDVDENMTIWAYAELDDYNDSPVVSATYVINDIQNIIFNQDWEDDWNGWTQVSVEGDAVWTIASYQGNHYAYMNGYSGGEAHQNEDWLISPAFNLDSYTDVVLSFRTAKNYTGDDLVVYFSNDYDGQNLSTATWQTITCALSQGSWNWVESGAISMDDFSGSNCHIAYKYTSTDEQAAGWEVDDILLTSGNAGIPSITATPNAFDFEYLVGQGPSVSKSYILTSANLEGTGNVTVTASENFEIALDNAAFGSNLTLEFANGIIINQPLTVYVRMAAGLAAGTYEGTITHNGGGASATVSLTGIVIGEGEPYITSVMPMYIQGNNGTNNNRVPVATEVLVYNLMPNTTYRYTNQFVDSNDGPETAGAGNVVYADANGFYRSTNPSLSTEGGYGEFTTDDEGNAIVWCVNEPTANARFTPGNQVYLRIRINDGNDGTSVAHAFTTQDYATVLNFGNGRDNYEGTAFYAKSDEAPKGFAVMYANSGDNRPIYATSIETTGVDYGSINQYADFYKDLVAGNDGWFGGILPNDNETGINMIWMVDLEGNAYTHYTTDNGFWQPDGNTVNPNGGLDTPVFIDLTYDGVNETEEANVNVWNTGHEFVIENGDDSHYIMTVYNLLGQPMMQRQINAGSTERISHSLASGLYIINLQNNHNKVATKVIVR